MPTPISAADAVARVKLQSSFDTFPEVDGAVVEAIVVESARPDAEGHVAGDEDWTPTYDLNAATAAVFELKAATAANRYDTSTDGQALSRSQLVAQLRMMAKLYRDRVASTLRRVPPS
jgi:hypothetical protein